MASAALSVHAADQTAAPWVLVEEITHRVVNEYTQAIASLVLAAAEAPDPGSQAALRAAAARLRAYAEAHRALRAPCGTELLDFGDYLQTLCAALASAGLRDRGVHLTLIPCAVAVAAERCWRVGLIVSELVANAARHAFAGAGGRVRIETYTVGSWVCCRVSDDGCAPVDAPRPGLGRTVVERLASELGGEIRWVFGPRGTSVLLSVPNPLGAIQ